MHHVGSMLPISDADLKRVQETFREDGIIQAIKVYREITGQGLAESKSAVEAIVAGKIAPSSGTPVAPLPAGPSEAEIMQRIHEALREGNKITAIKLYRDLTGAGLAEAKAAVEAMLPAIINPSVAALPETGDRHKDIEEAIRGGQTIMAIKLYRELHGAGLAEAKAAVEAMMAPPFPSHIPIPASTSISKALPPKQEAAKASGGCLMSAVNLLLAAAFVSYGVTSVMRASRNQDTDMVWLWAIITVLVGGFFFIKSLRRK